MDELRRISRRAMARATLRRFVRVCGIALSVAMGAAFALLLLNRLVGPVFLGREVAWWWIVAPAGVLAIVGAALFATLLRRVGPIEATAEVDEALRLKDRLASALALSERDPDDPFVGIALEEASAIASKVSVRRAIPIRRDAWWWAWPVLAASALGVGIFVPQLDILGKRKAEAARVERVAMREAAAGDIDQTARDIESALKNDGEARVADPLAQEKLSRLDELRNQLSSGEKDSDEARSEAAGVLGDLADRFAQEAKAREMEGQAAQDLFGGLDTGDPGQTQDAVDQLAEAMRRADADGVRRAAEQLQKELERMTPEERARAAERLRELATQLDELSKRAEERAAERRERAQEQLQEQGMPPDDAASMADRTDGEQMNDDLRDRGLDEESARRLSESIAEQNRQREAEEKAAERARDASKALDEAAKDAEWPDKPRPDQSTDDPKTQDHEQTPEEEQEQNRARDDQSQQKPDSDTQQSQKQSQQQRQGHDGQQAEKKETGEKGEQGEKSQQSQQGDQSEQRESKGDQRKGSEPKQGEQGQQQQQQPGAQPRSLGPDPSKPQGEERRQDGKPSNAPEGSQQREGSSSQSQQQNQQGAKPQQGAEPGKGQPQSQPGDQAKEGAQQPQQPGKGAPQQPGQGGAEPGAQPQPTPGAESNDGSQGPPSAQPDQGAQPDAKGQKPAPGSGAKRDQPKEDEPEGDGAKPGGSDGAGAADDTRQDTMASPGASDQSDSTKRPGGGGGIGESDSKRNDSRGAAGADENAQGSGAEHAPPRPPQDARGLEQLRKQFEEMRKNNQDAQTSKQRADEMRKRAEELLEKMSPEEREQLDRWARDLMREQHQQATAADPGDYTTEPVDARRPEASGAGRVVGEMEADPNAPAPDPGRVSNREFAEQMAGSLESAEKAMDERVVPTRYSNVERYFRQALERMRKQETEQSGEPAPDGAVQPAQDVPAKPGEGGEK